jgi:diguanylate cyclase (GGDEF)-like protein
LKRLEGEEFLILLPESNFVESKNVAERLRQNIAQMKLEYNKTFLNVTMSFGVQMFESTCDIDGLIKQADEFLYQAKEGGRNRVVSPEPHPGS